VTTQLIGLPYSPWSEKARWALEARSVPYTFVPYAPLLGELKLRRLLRQWSGRVSVPVLVPDGEPAIADSAAIARWGETRGDGPALFPPGREAEMNRFIEASERGLAAGRARSLRRMLEDDDALAEMVPRKIVKSIGRGNAVRLGRFGVGRTRRKYGGHRIDDGEHERVQVEVFDMLRAAIATSSPGLLGAFSFADIAMAAPVAFLEPPAFGLRIGAASRAQFADPALAARYPDLLRWRDALYDAYRPKSRS
jgi:glutathione S-transferase